MAYGDFKDLPKIIDTDNALRDKAFNIGSNPKHDENQRQLASIVHNFLIKKMQVVPLKMNSCKIQN